MVKSKLKVYTSNIQGRGGNKLAQLLARTHDCDAICLNETNTRRGGENSIGLNCKAVVITDGGESEKQLGYGTMVGTKKFNPNTDSIRTSNEHEVASVRIEIDSNTFATFICMYLSPNDCADRVNRFFELLDTELDFAINSNKDDLVLLSGDSNSDVGTIRHGKLMTLCDKYGGISTVNEPTRGRAQLDHCLAFYNALRYSVTSTVIPGVGDHSAIMTEIIPQKVTSMKERWTKREVVIDRGNYDNIFDSLSSKLKVFDHSILDTNNPFHIIPDQGILDGYYEDLLSIVEQTIREHRHYKTIFLPEYKHVPIKSRQLRDVSYCENMVIRAARKLEKKPTDATLKAKLEKARSNYIHKCTNATKSIVEKDIEKKRKYRNSDPSAFFKAVGMHLKFEGVASTQSEAAVETALDKAETNYLLKGPPFDPAKLIGLFKGKTRAKLNDNIQYIEFRMSKLQKVDSQLKQLRGVLAPAISFIIKLINISGKYPSVAKISRLIFLPTRTIFYLTFFPKILDDIAERSWHGKMPPDTEGQMAYIPDRSGNLCVAKQLHEVEICDEPVCNEEWDQVKAFDTGRWEPVILDYEREIGCGSMLYEYLQGQTYEFIYDVTGRNRLGFQKEPRGRGFWPGGKCAPHLFSNFQGSNKWLNKSESVWLDPGKFSDDASPISRWSRVLNGDVQRQLSGVYAWSKEQFIDFHLTGKKAPKYYVYRKDSDPVGDYHTDFMFDDVKFERGYDKRHLGIKINFFNDNEPANKYGYVIDWTAKKPISSVSNMLQEMKYAWDTSTLRNCTQAYVVGKLNFAASLHWLRASQQSTARARFDYSMALAACVGASTPEVVGMMNCKSRRVSKNNKNYIELCRYLDLPSLEEMAIKDARSLIKQWSIYEPDAFQWYIPHQPLGQDPWPEVHFAVNTEYAPEGTLLSDLYQLSKRDIVERYPHYHHCKSTGSFDKLSWMEQLEISPDYVKDLHVCKIATNDTWEQLGLTEPSSREIANTFWLLIRDKFNVLERYARLCKRLPVVSLSVQEKRTHESDDPPPKKPRLTISDCSSGIPWRRAAQSKDLDKCRVCGYYIEFRNAISLGCCDKKAHRNCVLNQPEIADNYRDARCRDLSNFMKRGGRFADPNVVFSKPPTLNREQVRARNIENLREELFCAVCRRQIESDDPVRLRNHLIMDCVTVPADSANRESKFEMSRRLAALSAIYKINNGVRIFERIAPVEEPPDGGMLPNGSGGRHNPFPTASGSAADTDP